MSSQIVMSNTEAAILARVIESDPSAITPDVARYLRCDFLAPTRNASTNSQRRLGPAH
jgi:hypothetical protein